MFFNKTTAQIFELLYSCVDVQSAFNTIVSNNFFLPLSGNQYLEANGNIQVIERVLVRNDSEMRNEINFSSDGYYNFSFIWGMSDGRHIQCFFNLVSIVKDDYNANIRFVFDPDYAYFSKNQVLFEKYEILSTYNEETTRDNIFTKTPYQIPYKIFKRIQQGEKFLDSLNGIGTGVEYFIQRANVDIRNWVYNVISPSDIQVSFASVLFNFGTISSDLLHYKFQNCLYDYYDSVLDVIDSSLDSYVIWSTQTGEPIISFNFTEPVFTLLNCVPYLDCDDCDSINDYFNMLFYAISKQIRKKESEDDEMIDYTPVLTQIATNLSNMSNDVNAQLDSISSKLETTEIIDNSKKSITDVINQQSNTIQVDELGILRNKKGYY